MNRPSNKGCMWELSHSLWVLWTFFFMPCVGFFIIGKRVNHRPWLIWGGIYLACMLIVFTFIDSKYKDNSAFEAFLVAYFLGSFVHTFVARSAYIQKLLQQENEEEEYYRQRQVGGMGYAGPNRTEQFANQYNTRRNNKTEGMGNANTQHTSTTERTDHTAVNTPPRQTAAETVTPVDINSCTLTEMTALPGVNIVMAKQAVKYRYEHGGFSSFEEFAEVVKLKPHFIVQLQDLVMCKPIDAQSQQSQQGSAQQQPEQPGPEHHGRRLDL
jgi:DNA uptake protein ComE-like DNA-binding protein